MSETGGFLEEHRRAWQRFGESMAPALEAARVEMGKFAASMTAGAEEALRKVRERMLGGEHD